MINANAVSVPDQGKRILPFAITENVARHFFARFWGREDVYAKRSVNKKTGKAGYFPQCDNFWHYGVCPKANRVKIQCSKCENQSYSKLGIMQIMEHLKGEKEDASDVIGVAFPFRKGSASVDIFYRENSGKACQKIWFCFVG